MNKLPLPVKKFKEFLISKKIFKN